MTSTTSRLVYSNNVQKHFQGHLRYVSTAGRVVVGTKGVEVSKCRVFSKERQKRKERNHRPVSLASIVCRLLEKINRKQMGEHLQWRNFISEKHHWYGRKIFLITNLIESYDKLGTSLKKIKEKNENQH